MNRVMQERGISTTISNIKIPSHNQNVIDVNISIL